MKDIKKSRRADLEHRRVEMFLVALVLILSLAYCALGWNVGLRDGEDDASIEEIMEDIDFDRLKKDLDMVAAIENTPPADEAKSVVVVARTEEAAQEEQANEETADDEPGGKDKEKETPDEPSKLFSTPLSDSESLVVMERMPEFPGGASAFMKWITSNIKYPPAAQQRHITGKVVVSFIVDEEGNATKLALVSADDRRLGNAVMSVMSRMPKWIPGVQDGKICRTMIKVPINFEL
ncbi:MAG: TonB family protein [Prevotella sp.]|nr:TonB family protein [Prevotella sp.]